jgi:hypothetical protein
MTSGLHTAVTIIAGLAAAASLAAVALIRNPAPEQPSGPPADDR